MIVRNVTFSVSVSLTALQFIGWWAPDGLTRQQKILYNLYTAFSFMFLLGIYLIIQVVDLFIIWGDLVLMTGTAFLLFTNLAQAAKIVNLLSKRDRIQKIVNEADIVLRDVHSEEAKRIVESCNKETKLHQMFFLGLTMVTTLGWATSAEKGNLPLRAWYPYDTTKSPAFELTYCHQVGALVVAAYLNVAKDTLVTGLIAQCRCRLRLLSLALRMMGDGIKISEMHLLSRQHEAIISTRLRSCVEKHEAALTEALHLQDCFSVPTFAQFTVSLIIICVSAFQMVTETANMVRLLSMSTYVVNMMFQVFMYCYQGHHLSEDSSDVAGAAYECPWYVCSVRLRRSILVVMSRTQRVAKLNAGGFTALTLASFMGIIKASYSLFTLLQQVNAKN